MLHVPSQVAFALKKSKTAPTHNKPALKSTMTQRYNLSHQPIHGHVSNSGAAETLVKSSDWVFLDTPNQEGLNKE